MFCSKNEAARGTVGDNNVQPSTGVCVCVVCLLVLVAPLSHTQSVQDLGVLIQQLQQNKTCTFSHFTSKLPFLQQLYLTIVYVPVWSVAADCHITLMSNTHNHRWVMSDMMFVVNVGKKCSCKTGSRCKQQAHSSSRHLDVDRYKRKCEV